MELGAHDDGIPTPVPEDGQGAGHHEVTVIVVTYNSEELLADFVAHLDSGLQGVDHQLVVVDNDSTDTSVELAARLRPDALIVQTGRNAGYAAGINAGVLAARPHSAILVLNPDVRLGTGCARTLLDALGAPGVGISAPRLTTGEGRLIHSIRREPTIGRMVADAVVGARRAGRIGRWGEVVTAPACYETDRTVDWVEGSTMMIAASTWQRVGPWDESFFLYSEETDYALRARDAALGTLFVARAHAVHLQGGSAGSVRLWPLVTVNKWKLFRKRRGGVASALFLGALVLREGSRAALGNRASRAALAALLSHERLLAARGPQWLR